MKRDFNHRNEIGTTAMRTHRLQQTLAEQGTRFENARIHPPSTVLATGTCPPDFARF